MNVQPEITQQDLRTWSAELVDAVARGQTFTLTRDGRRVGELIPLRQQRRFVTRQEFASVSKTVAAPALDAFRADQDAASDHDVTDSYTD